MVEIEVQHASSSSSESMPQTVELFADDVSPVFAPVRVPIVRDSALDRVLIVAAFEADMIKGKICNVRLLQAAIANTVY